MQQVEIFVDGLKLTIKDKIMVEMIYSLADAHSMALSKIGERYSE